MGKNVIVFGADGYIGWPMAMHLSRLGYAVMAVDNLSRRDWDAEGGTFSLLPLRTMAERVARWQQMTGHRIDWRQADLCDFDQLDALVAEWQPDAVVHFGEQRSAPFSMIDRDHAARTQANNILGNLNLLYAIHDRVPDCHLVKLGTMGEYGCPNIDIEEGFIDIEHNGRRDRLPFPKLPHSFYHLSKVADSQNIHFACRIWDMRATDLNQGVVYGNVTPETALHPDLVTRLDFDSVWGTALNRFCVQAACGQPITVYGRGGQTRGYLDIRDTMACITLALQHPAEPGEYRVFNQFTEQFSLNELAELVAEARRARGEQTTIAHLPNPRVEMEEHYYNARHSGLLELGLQPHYLGDTLVHEFVDLVAAHAQAVNMDLLNNPSVDWRTGGNEVWHRHATPAANGAARNGNKGLSASGIDRVIELPAPRHTANGNGNGAVSVEDIGTGPAGG